MYSYMDQVGAENCVPKRKAPLTHLLITSLLSLHDAPILKKGAVWNYSSSIYGVSIYTLWHVLAQTGFRKDEISLGKGDWSPNKLSFQSLTWRINGKIVRFPNHAQLQSLRVGDYAVLYPPPSKADQFGMRWGNNPVWLPYCPDAAINAARAHHPSPIFPPGRFGHTRHVRQA